MKFATSLKTRLILLMVLLVILQSLALLLAMSVSRVTSLLDEEAVRLFNSTTSARSQEFNLAAGELISNVGVASEHLSEEAQSVAGDAGLTPDEIYQDNDAYNQFALAGAQAVLGLLQTNDISGAFFMLNGSNANPNDEMAHSGVYIRNSAAGSTNNTENYLLELGPTVVVSNYQLATSTGWDLDVRFSNEHPEQYAFYTRPIMAATQIENAEIERYGYWSSPNAALGGSQQVVYYTLPILDADGQAYGVLGVEMSLEYFTQQYLPNIDLPYANSFYAIAPVHDDKIILEWIIPSGPLAQVHLSQGEELIIEQAMGNEDSGVVYRTELATLGEMYCSLQQLRVYSDNSPFAGENWTLVGFVPSEVLHESSQSVMSTLLISMVVVMIISIIGIFIMVHIATLKISKLSKYMAKLSPHQDIHFDSTGMREIDELTAAVKKLNDSVINASKTTSKILELTLLPLGGFEVSTEADHVILTEYLYKLLCIDETKHVSHSEWEELITKLTAEPAHDQENIYQYTHPETGEDIWLRILQTKTATGEVGVILDTTKDVEERKRLAHELDYDALTGLYSRVAFKREVHLMIQSSPDKIGAMIFADLDNLKYINDMFGHDMGDRLIIKTGDIFREFSSYGALVSRISGDEFAVYLHGFSTKEEARQLINEQYEESASTYLETPDGASHRIRYSSGVAWYPEDSDNVTDLLKLSDYAMYTAKSTTKGTLCEFSQEAYDTNAYLLDNREAINRLLDDKLIRFAFQPIVCLKTGKIFAYEALMRPLLDNFKSPAEVLKVAAWQSKLGQLEQVLIFTAFETISDHVHQLGDIKIFVNSIPSHSLSKEEIVRLKREYSDLLDRVVIEITEGEGLSSDLLDAKTAAIKGAGMQVAIDDYGSGYSNEMRVLAIQPDLIKVDMSMIQGIHKDADKQTLVSNLVEFCHSKNISVVAEGLEEFADLEMLAKLKVDYVQGYYLGKPDFKFLPIPDEIVNRIIELQG